MRDKEESTFTSKNSDTDGKTCPTCNAFKQWSLFGKNKSKPDGHESSCKQCVSERKKRAYQKKQKELKKIKSVDQYSSDIEGELSDDSIDGFSEIFEEIYRGLHYEGKI